MPSSASSRSSSFATDVLKLVTGTTLAQVITVLASPVITRLYGPEAFGFLAVFTSITSIIGVVACMRYELAIMLPKTDEEAANLLGLSLPRVAGVSGLTVPALYFGGDALLSLLRHPGLTHTSSWFRRLSLPAGVSCVEQPELARQIFRPVHGCLGHQFACHNWYR
jgi:O-antigen/teichoic acid export membrane protein